jgi:hypothetical protein
MNSVILRNDYLCGKRKFPKWPLIWGVAHNVRKPGFAVAPHPLAREKAMYHARDLPEVDWTLTADSDAPPPLSRNQSLYLACTFKAELSQMMMSANPPSPLAVHDRFNTVAKTSSKGFP